jgi:hypothetical protein
MWLVLYVQSNFLDLLLLTTAGHFPHTVLELSLNEIKNSTYFREDNFQSAPVKQSPEY